MERLAVIGLVVFLATGAFGQDACNPSPCQNNRDTCHIRNSPEGYVCQCTLPNRSGYDCTTPSDSQQVFTCYGSDCATGVFSSNGYPNNYPNRYTALYLIYVPGASGFTFTFDTGFAIDANRDELYVGAGLDVDFPAIQTGMINNGMVFFFDGYVAPVSFTVMDTDTIWMYFLTDKNIAQMGFQVRWSVMDNTPPVVTCPTYLRFEVPIGVTGRQVTWDLPTVTDNSGSFFLVSNTNNPNDFFPVGSNTVTYTYRDAANNRNSCSFTVEIVEVDNTPPVVTCPTNLRIEVPISVTGRQVTWDLPTVTDNSGSFFLVSNTNNPNDFFPVGSNIVTYTYRDAANNRNSCSFTVEIVEDIDDCANNPCQNGGTCNDGVNQYSCACTTGFAGNDCQLELDPCVDGMPCLNGGSCVTVGGSTDTECMCMPGFSGTRCTVDVCMCYTNANAQQKDIVCIIEESCNVDDLLQELSQVYIDEGNVKEVSAALANATSYPGNHADGIASVALTLENIAGLESPSLEVTTNVIKTVDNIMNISDIYFSTNRSSSAKILHAFESQLSFAQDNISMTLDNIAVEVLPSVSLANSLGFASKPKSDDIPVDDTLLNNDEKLFEGDVRIPVSEAEASILLPTLSLQSSTVTTSTLNKSVSVVFVVYANPILFQLPQSNTHLKLNSLVISGSIGGKEIQVTNLTNPVITSFRPRNNTEKGQAVCVFWDPTLANGNSAGNWSTEGCSVSEDNGTGEATLCHCNHLTNFAILISHDGDIMLPVLDILSKIGCGISVAALVLTIVVTVITEGLSSTPRKTLLNLCVSLIFLYGVFLVGIEFIQPRVACIVFASLIHYFFLSSVCWSSAEAIICFYLLALTRRNLADGYLLRMMFFCWGIPAVIVSVTLAVPYFIGGQVNVAHEKYCFLSPGNSIYFGVMLPVGALLLFNIFIYILVFRRLVCQRIKSSLTLQETRVENVLRQARTMIPIAILLGGTWIFGFLAIGVFTTIFQYIFAILNSLIGAAVFVFFVLFRKNGRQGLKKVICCLPSGGSHSTSRDGRSNNAYNTNSTGL